MTSFQCDVYRYQPESDEKPWMKSYEVPERMRKAMVLDVLEFIKTQDASLSYRRSCREGVCGSDGMNINGFNCLACTTRCGPILDKHKTLVLRPLTGMPVVRDLVVDLQMFFEQYERVEPWLKNHHPEPAIERLQSPQERDKLNGLYECILCACCTSACPSWWWNPDSYIGPAGLLWAARFLDDSRDTAERERLQRFMDDPFALFRCRNIQNCTHVCPKGLNPMKAIGSIRHRLTAKYA